MLRTTRVEPDQVAMTEAYEKLTGLNPVTGEYCRSVLVKGCAKPATGKGALDPASASAPVFNNS